MLGLLALLAMALVLLVALLTAVLAWRMVHPPRRTAAWAVARGLPSDPGECDLQFEEWWLDCDPAGVRLPVWEIRTARDSMRSGGLTAVFTHGWGHGRVNALQRIKPFVGLVDRIVLYDLRGHGDSTAGASRLGDGEDDDLLALLDRLSDGPLLLVGHSMGAVIALNAALKRRAGGRSEKGGAIAGVIAYGPYCDFHVSLRGRLRNLGQPARPLTDLALWVHRLRGVRPLGVDPQQIASLNVPLLIVHGVNDPVSPLSHARAIAQAAPQAELIEVNDAAHADTHIVDVDGHERVIRDFVERVRADAWAAQS